MAQGFDPYSGQRAKLGQMGNLSQAMYEQAQSPIQNHGIPGSAVSITQVLSKLANAYYGNKADKEHTEGLNELAQQRQGSRNEGMNALMQGVQGDDPQTALFNARAHPDEAVRSAATEYSKGMMTQKDFAKQATPESILTSGGNVSQFKPKQNLTSLTPGAPVVNDAGVMVDPSVGAVEGAKPVISTNPNGDIIQTSPTGMKLVNDGNRTTVSNSTTVNNIPGALGETAYEKAFGTSQGRANSKHVEDRPVLIGAIDSANEGLKLLEQGIHTGALGNLAKGVDKASIALFNTDPSKATRTEQFMGSAATQVLAALQQLGGNDSNEDRKYLMGVMGGDITAEPDTLKAIMKRVIARSRQQLTTGDRAVQNYRDRGKSLPTIDEGTLPSPRQDHQSGGSGGNLDDFLKSKGY